jgi:hypothetical protein
MLGRKNNGEDQLMTPRFRFQRFPSFTKKDLIDEVIDLDPLFQSSQNYARTIGEVGRNGAFQDQQ